MLDHPYRNHEMASPRPLAYSDSLCYGYAFLFASMEAASGSRGRSKIFHSKEIPFV